MINFTTSESFIGAFKYETTTKPLDSKKVIDITYDIIRNIDSDLFEMIKSYPLKEKVESSENNKFDENKIVKKYIYNTK